MRIISGKYKNRELKSPNSSATHPMGERERLAIFNMLLSNLPDTSFEGKTILDLFAGTGSLGLEALSRGASSAVFVENNPKTFVCLKENLKDIPNVKLSKADAYHFETEDRFDIIFLDPPYDKFPEEIASFKQFLNPNGIMVISSPKPLDDTSRKFASCFITLMR